MFDWDRNNLPTIRAHRIKLVAVEEALSRDPILICRQDADREVRSVYHGETDRSRMIPVVPTERGERIGVVGITSRAFAPFLPAY